MKLLSGIAGLTLASVVAIASANSADLYRGQAGGYKDGPIVAPVATWTGFYAGINGGYGWDDVDAPVNFDGDFNGGFGGGQIGYNWQGAFGTSPLVIGIEADIQGSGLGVEGVLAQSDELNLNYFGTVRGRLGYALGNTLVYATGGFAYGEFEYKLPGVGSASDTTTGYVVGGGLEHKFTQNISGKVEYQYLAFDDESFRGSDLEFGVNTIRAGLNYHFGATGYEPLK
ncbi:porin [Rhodomicrobium udaipurense JA643]|uniref:Porin family protein n=1 Tax=Rhodomicrobium udaipurense TaxID=1202716 RepID=A0A8I1GD60_9HYPH|nr:outer membrane beta-barrel protein [Rhodomicrobium udaipurense]KAI94789.1 porin [Rhodomicrobium udaipurense JA643]MBJ7544877.1 porin family protein [Rhodomicrobium udaipurense]